MAMPREEGCVFCRIIDGTLPSIKLYEDDETIAFMDIKPFSEGHCLAVTKGHWPDISSIPAEAMAATAKTAHKVGNAVWKAMGCDGVSIVQANGTAASQTVFHLHIHMIPRWHKDAGIASWAQAKMVDNPATLEPVAADIRKALD